MGNGAIYEACTDCVMAIANGDTSGIEDLAAWAARVEATDLTSGGKYTAVVYSDHEYFSHYGCDYCGDTLGGDRHDIILIG